MLSSIRPYLLTTAAVLTSLVHLPASTLFAQEFRIETEIYVGTEEEPTSRTVTLFEESAVYDFVENPTQVIVYRRGAGETKGQFVILDPNSKQRTDVDVKRIESLMKKIDKWAGDQEDELLNFCASPFFDESFTESSGELSLENKLWTYEAATVPVEEPGALKRYREFTDNYARLNTMLHGTPPPGPRLKLNAALVKHGVAPVEIRRTINGNEKHQVRAAHLFSWRLSREDRARLDEVRRDLANFEKVDNKDFVAATRNPGEERIVRGQSQ